MTRRIDVGYYGYGIDSSRPEPVRMPSQSGGEAAADFSAFILA